jgi:PTS system glucitol/sorbitol-specific IIC component
MVVLDVLIGLAQGLSKFFADAGAEFLAWSTDIVPLALVALTVLNAIVSLIGEDRFDGISRKLTNNFFARYTLLPYLANFLAGSPSSFVFGRYLHEKYKPGFYEVNNRTNMAPMMCLFPHVNPGELFVWLGIYNGVVQGYGEKAGALLAVSTFLLAFCTSSLIGLTVEKMAGFLARRQGIDFEVVEASKHQA